VCNTVSSVGLGSTQREDDKMAAHHMSGELNIREVSKINGCVYSGH
jgi:hypothetical protein